MSYIKLKKAGGAFDLIPADNIIYVIGTEGAAETGVGDGLAPFVRIVQAMGTATDKLIASKVIVGPATGVAATSALSAPAIAQVLRLRVRAWA